jgi:peptidoglycan/LPS O-acetylase OafA/YrhL
LDFSGKDALFKTLEALFFAFVIFDQCYNGSQRFKLGRVGWLTRLGKYTYGIYMLHSLILYSIGIACVALKFSVALKYILFLIVGLPLVLGLAYLSYEYFEKSFLLLKQKFGYRNNADTGEDKINEPAPAIADLIMPAKNI